jgi:hypothetical protein
MVVLVAITSPECGDVMDWSAATFHGQGLVKMLGMSCLLQDPANSTANVGDLDRLFKTLMGKTVLHRAATESGLLTQHGAVRHAAFTPAALLCPGIVAAGASSSSGSSISDAHPDITIAAVRALVAVVLFATAKRHNSKGGLEGAAALLKEMLVLPHGEGTLRCGDQHCKASHRVTSADNLLLTIRLSSLNAFRVATCVRLLSLQASKHGISPSRVLLLFLVRGWQPTRPQPAATTLAGW